ncbi:hypothetical protein NQ315_000995 [Exocentrus adspersus]|uniref:Uncharacterized protein n=1 Tax=Exocentrus adspersus TaxID=1586481 RepID=A0AAV8WFA7_9CUCU|nr:hypothetical protein NQ315_000995 [Exocentrus adspersus]
MYTVLCTKETCDGKICIEPGKQNH